MKTQNVSQSLDFRKNSVVELSDKQLQEIEGGSSRVCSFISGVLVDAIVEKLHISVYDM